MLTFSPGSCLVYVGRLVCCAYGYSITGGANNRFNVTHGYIQCPREIALVGYPKFGAFAVALGSSLIDLRNAVFSGSATGQRYYVNTLSLFLTGGRAN